MIVTYRLKYILLFTITILFYLKNHSSSLSLNDLNRLEPRGCKLIRLTGRAIQVSDEADKQQNFQHQKFQLSETPLKWLDIIHRNLLRRFIDFSAISLPGRQL